MTAIDDAKLEQLTREMGWIRGLARALVRTDAEDLAQDAWLVAARDAPTDRPLRPWLVRMTTNLARMRGRSASRRDARDQHAEPPPAVPTPQQLVERVELGRIVAEEVVALGEPYRSTILLHFFEGLSSAEIGRRLDLPDGTIRRRLKVGLDQLRVRLRERSDAPSGGWLAALIPLAGPPPAPPPIAPIGKAATATATTTTSSSAGTLLVVAAIALVVAGGVVWQLVEGDRGDLVSTAPPLARVYPASKPSDSNAPPVAEGSLIYGQPGAPARRLRGIVTADGAPVANAVVHLGVEVVAARPLQSWEPPRSVWGSLAAVAHVTTDAKGHFDFGERPAARYVITAQSNDRASASTIVEAANPKIRVDELELALGACAAKLAGRVHDAQGTGLVAHVETSDLSAVDTTAHGDFAMCVAPDPTLVVTADGYAATSRKLAGTGELHADISLVPGSAASGRVVDERDQPVHSARVTAVPVAFGTVDNAAERLVASDDDGRFEIDQLAAGRWFIRAVAADAGAATEAVVTIEPGAVIDDVRLVVTPRVHVRGRVTLDGAPVVGAEIEGSFHAYSQRDGSFEVAGIAPGWVQLGVVGFVVPETRFIVDGTREIELPVAQHAHVVGVVTSNSAACEGATVMCPDGPNTTTDVTGAYTCNAPVYPQGDHHEARFYATAACNTGDWKLHRGEAHVILASNTAATVDMHLGECGCPPPEPPRYPPPPPPVHCRGSVGSASGERLANALVWVGESAATTDATGAFVLDGCGVSYPGMKLVATVFATRDAQAPLTVVSFTGDGDTTPYAITVDTEPMMIRGRVLDPDRKPVVDARVALVGKIGLRGASGDDHYAATTLADGRFSIGPVAKFAHYTLTAAVGNLRGEVLDVAGDTDIIVGGNGSIHGDLQGDWDSPTVLVRSLAGPPAERTASVDDYELELRDVPPGLYEVVAYDRQIERRGTAIVQSGKIAHVSLFGHGNQGESRARLVDVTTHAGIPGMACQQGSHMPVVLGGDGGQIVNRQSAVSCWSSRGPAVPVLVDLAPTDCGQCTSSDDPTLVQLVRPGSVHPGFVVAPLSSPPVVAVVDPGGSAQAAGLEPDDAIIELDGAGVAQLSPQDLMYLMWTHTRGSMRLGVRRGSSMRTIIVTLP